MRHGGPSTWPDCVPVCRPRVILGRAAGSNKSDAKTAASQGPTANPSAARLAPSRWKSISPLKNALASFNLAKCGAKLRTEAQYNDLRRSTQRLSTGRYFVIASMRCRSLLSKSTGCYTLRQDANPVSNLGRIASVLCIDARYFEPPPMRALSIIGASGIAC